MYTSLVDSMIDTLQLDCFLDSFNKCFLGHSYTLQLHDHYLLTALNRDMAKHLPDLWIEGRPTLRALLHSWPNLPLSFSGRPTASPCNTNLFPSGLNLGIRASTVVSMSLRVSASNLSIVVLPAP